MPAQATFVFNVFMAISFLWILIIQDHTMGDSLSWDYTNLFVMICRGWIEMFQTLSVGHLRFNIDYFILTIEYCFVTQKPWNLWNPCQKFTKFYIFLHKLTILLRIPTRFYKYPPKLQDTNHRTHPFAVTDASHEHFICIVALILVLIFNIY